MKSDSMQLIYGLWDELSAFPAGCADEALIHLMRWFQKHLDVDNVIWLGSLLMLDEMAARNDPLLGWRLRVRRSFILERESYQKLVASYFANEHYGRLTPAFYRKGNRPDADVHVGMASRAVVRGAGTFRVHRMRDGWIDYGKFRKTEHYRLYYEEPEIADRIWLIFPVSPTVESIILLDRYKSGKRAHPHFTKEEAGIAGTALRGAREFHRRLLLQHGVYKSVKPLTPLKTRVLQGLLSGKPEKEIAASLGQKPMTMRKYVKELYVEFGVRTRPELMSLWLGES
jgi:DNA-binding CsgD family transcriptional regulator